LLLALSSAALAQDAPDLAAVAAATGDTTTGLNIMWVVLASFLIFFMQAGFALVETGFTRAKNVAHTMMMNMMVFCIGALGYYFVGFGLQFGGVNYTYPELNNLSAWSFSPITMGDWSGLLDKPLLIGEQFGVMGLSGFMLSGLTANVGVLAFFLFQMVFMDTAATIPTGSMAERLDFRGFVWMSLWVSMFIYPVAAMWVWGGGWLANLGRTMGWGNGAVDFAGSGVVHLIGGAVALAGAIVIGPRIGRFNKDGSANAIPGHNIPMGVLGTIILFFGWFGFNPGSSLGFTGGFRDLALIAAVNTLLAGAAGGVAAMFYMWWAGPTKKPDPAMSVNGILAGLVAITAPCAFVDTWAAVVIGLISGVLACLATFALEKMHIDDPVGAVPVHFVNGMFGALAVGIFANGNPLTAAWYGVDTPVTGLLYGGSTQILAQSAQVVSVALFVFVGSFLFFKVLSGFKVLRSKAADELAGLDLPEMGAPGYTNDDLVMQGGMPGSRIRGAMSPTRPPAAAPVTR
jgi:Amt family ammonium transporter